MTRPSVEEQLRELQEMATDDLVALYTKLKGQPPRRKYARWLRKRIAWLIQERAYGGLSVAAKRRIKELQQELDLPFDRPDDEEREGRGVSLHPGTSLQREWHGQQVQVDVIADNAFEWNGERYTSLSAVATAVTGTRWNGRLFFGLPKTRRRA